jgi:hypothetical protein
MVAPRILLSWRIRVGPSTCCDFPEAAQREPTGSRSWAHGLVDGHQRRERARRRRPSVLAQDCGPTARPCPPVELIPCPPSRSGVVETGPAVTVKTADLAGSRGRGLRRCPARFRPLRREGRGGKAGTGARRRVHRPERCRHHPPVEPAQAREKGMERELGQSGWPPSRNPAASVRPPLGLGAVSPTPHPAWRGVVRPADLCSGPLPPAASADSDRGSSPHKAPVVWQGCRRPWRRTVRTVRTGLVIRIVVRLRACAGAPWEWGEG